MECLGVPENVTQRVLQEWLEGKGLEPVTWETLIQTLRDSGLSPLAEHIQLVPRPCKFLDSVLPSVVIMCNHWGL